MRALGFRCCLFLLIFFRTRLASKALCGDELRDISSFPGQEAYEEGVVVWNSRYEDMRPAFIAFPESAKDVQRCLKCSMKFSVPCVVRCGGHSNVGYSTIGSSGFVIHLGKMKNISCNGNIASVQAGALMGEVYDKLKETGYLFAGGICYSVGVSGYTLGGGQGFLNRRYGLGCDNVESMIMVTANGSDIVYINETINSDLFWALRGGGGGNFGIVTDFNFKIHNDSFQNYMKISLSFDAGHAAQQAFVLLGELESQFSDEIFAIPYIFHTKDFQVEFLYPLSLDDSLATIIKPMKSISNRITYTNYSSYYDVFDFASQPQYARNLIRACFLSSFDVNIAKIFFESSIVEGCTIVFNHLGGAIRRLKNTDTAYFYRDATFYYYAECVYQDDDKKYISFLDSLYETLVQNGYCLGNYINDMDSRLINWQKKYYGDNYGQLLKLKEKWNSFNSSYFHFPQEIGATFDPPKYQQNEKIKRSEL